MKISTKPATALLIMVMTLADGPDGGETAQQDDGRIG